MNTTAIRQAIKLYKHPLEMSALSAVHATLPSGVTDLLRLCASEKQMELFAAERNVNADMLYNILTHFIENVLFKEGCSAYKILGVDKRDTEKESTQYILRLHYKLLMKIYHPDRNRSSSSSFYASKISKAYEFVKKQHSEVTSALESRAYYEPPKSYYAATQKAQYQINQTRNTFLAITSVLLIAFVTSIIYLNQPDSSNLIVRNNTVSTTDFPQSQKISLKKDMTPFDHATYQDALTTKVSGKEMQVLLQNLEAAYEQGNVKQITPILANAPEMHQKSNQELSAKLETLFKITKERKMVLYDFSWVQIANKITGKGQFLSRYLLVGEDEWQTRTGPAAITAEIDNDFKIKIKTLDMNDQPVQQ